MRSGIGTGIIAVGLIFAVGCGASAPEDRPAETIETEPAAPAPEPEPEAEPEPETGGWRVSRSTNALDDSTTVVAVLNATEGVGGIMPEPISLIARCQSNTTEVYINWYDFLGDDDLGNPRSSRKRVTYRFPPADAETEMWGVSTDNDSTFVARAIPFLRTMVESDRLVAQTTPYNEAPSTAIFDLTGARSALEPLAETCNWILDPEEAAQERSRRDQARRAEQERHAEARRAERERILADMLGTPITSGLGLGGSGRDVNGSTYADLPAPVGAAHFVASVTPAQLSRARGTTGYTIVCPRGEWEDDQITLRDCTFSSPQEEARARDESERAAARERAEEARQRAEQERAQAREAQVERLLADGARFPAAEMSGMSSEGNIAYVVGGLPDGVSRAYFSSGINSSQLLDARRRQATVVCPRAESDRGNWVTLHDCTLTR